MSYTITISEVLNNIAIATEPYTVSISEVVNNVEVSIPAANAIAITNVSYPVTVSYNATVFSGGGGGGLNNVVEDASPQLGADLDVNGFAITSASNGNVTINPNGTGQVVIDSNATINGDVVIDGIIDLAGGYIWESNDSLGIRIYTGSYGGLKVGGFPGINSDANFTSDAGFSFTGTNGAAFSIGGGSTSPSNNVYLTPATTGDIYLSSDKIFVGDNNAAAIITTQGTGSLTINTNNGTSSGSIVIPQGVNSNITIAPNGTGDVILSADTVAIGDTNAQATLTTNGTGTLVLNTNNGSNSGAITITQGINGGIDIVPNGTGKLLLDNVYWPAADGSANQVLRTNGAGQSSWVSVSSLVSDVNTTYSVSAETVAGGANLRLTGTDATTDDVKIASGTNVTVARTDANTITINAETGTHTFLSESTPSSPDLGDHWFNPANQVLQIYTESGWLTVSADDLYY
jgi:hypothetical protein